MRSLLQPALRSSVVALVLVGAWAAAVFYPSFYRQHMQEDSSVEWASFFSFLIAAGLAARGLAQTRGRTLSRLALLGVGLFCLFVAAEEISWGQRLLGFKPPDIFLEHNYQQETNLHNFLKTIVDTRWVVLFIALVYGVIAPFAAKKLKWLAPLAPSTAFAPGFLAVALLEGLYPFELAGELAELLFGLLFLGDVVVRTGTPRQVLGWQTAALVVGLVSTPLIERLTYGDSQTRVAECQSELDLLRATLDGPGKLAKKLRKKRRVHKRLFTAVKARYLKLDGVTPDPDATPEGRRRFYLDPWNQPYWLLSVRDRNGPPRVLLYSFGPNRRRDSVLEPLRGHTPADMLSGDDVGVVIDFELNTEPSLSSQP